MPHNLKRLWPLAEALMPKVAAVIMAGKHGPWRTRLPQKKT